MTEGDLVCLIDDSRQVFFVRTLTQGWILVRDEDGLEFPLARGQYVTVCAAEQERYFAPKAPTSTTKNIPMKPHSTAEGRLLEIDLHFASDASSSDDSGNPSFPILELQMQRVKDTMRRYRTHKGMRIVFIHGHGQGILRTQLLNFIRTQYPHCPCCDASFKTYGFQGATQVEIR